MSFGIKSKYSNIKLISIKKFKKRFKATIKINHLKTYFFIPNDFQNYILNILAALAVMSIFLDISKLNKNIFIILKYQMEEEIFLKLKLIIKT